MRDDELILRPEQVSRGRRAEEFEEFERIFWWFCCSSSMADDVDCCRCWADQEIEGRMADDASRGRLNLEGKQVDTCKDFNE